MDTQETQVSTPAGASQKPEVKSKKALIIGLSTAVLLVGAMVLFIFKGSSSKPGSTTHGIGAETSRSTSASVPSQQVEQQEVEKDLGSLDKDISDLDKSLNDQPVNLSE